MQDYVHIIMQLAYMQSKWSELIVGSKIFTKKYIGFEYKSNKS